MKDSFDLRCHATLGEFDLIRINQSFATLRAAEAVAVTLMVFLSPRSMDLVKGSRWTITSRNSGQVQAGEIKTRR